MQNHKEIITKDSCLMMNPDLVAEAISSAFGDNTCVYLLTDLVSDSIPTHIVGAKVFLICKQKESFIAKIGIKADHLKEIAIIKCLKEVYNSTKPKKTAKYLPYIKFPDTIGIVDLPLHHLSALLFPLCGVHTIEIYRTAKDSCAIERDLRRAISSLAALNIAWPAVMPRNIIIERKKLKADKLCLVDWEMGFYELTSIQKTQDYYIRSIELMEEFSVFTEGLFPYWCKSWPTPEELFTWSNSRPLVSDVPIRDHRDPRIEKLGRLLGLPERVTDAEYFRIISLLTHLCEREPTLYSVLYSMDQLTEWTGLEFRLKCTLLAWHLSKSPALLNELYITIAKAANTVYHYWRSGIDITIIKSVLESLSIQIDGLAGYGSLPIRWYTFLIDQVSEFIRKGGKNGIIQYRVICSV